MKTALASASFAYMPRTLQVVLPARLVLYPKATLPMGFGALLVAAAGAVVAGAGAGVGVAGAGTGAGAGAEPDAVMNKAGLVGGGGGGGGGGGAAAAAGAGAPTLVLASGRAGAAHGCAGDRAGVPNAVAVLVAVAVAVAVAVVVVAVVVVNAAASVAAPWSESGAVELEHAAWGAYLAQLFRRGRADSAT